MQRRALLKKTMAMARTGDPGAFENFYILTVQETYGKIFHLMEDEEEAERLVVEVYAALYHQAHTLPLAEEDLLHRIEEEIHHQVTRELKEGLKDFNLSGEYRKLKEERAATLWIQLEEKLGLGHGESEERETLTSYLYSMGKILLTVAVLIATTAILYKGWQFFFQERETAAAPEPVKEETAAEETLLVIESEKELPGWKQSPDGKLYYVKKDGSYADGQLALGKQLLTFSRDGELTLIGDNRTVLDNGSLTFDEDECFEVRDGDIYRIDKEEEEAVVLNGHVVQADARCGFLWYISQYQIPNTSETKTTIYRCLLNGDKEEEIFTTDSILEMDSFQVTPEWYYYLSDGKLFRKSLSDGETEYLTSEVKYYFAWENTAYYMKDRTLESVSKGASYSGIEAGFYLEKTEGGYFLIRESGGPALDSENGEILLGDRLYRLKDGRIQSVAPAQRRNGNVTYSIEGSGLDRKIYWRDSSGARGLIPQEGLTVDSMCISGQWLYYSARTAQYGDECESRIYRLNLQSMEDEEVGESFRGFMRNLYYFDGPHIIAGEYIPSVADPEDIHGLAALVGEDSVNILNDRLVRPEAEGSDMLEILMADDNKIYCLYHQCSYDGSQGTFVWETTEALELEKKGRAEIVD